jgi:SAM-dependent methyltransferase
LLRFPGKQTLKRLKTCAIIIFKYSLQKSLNSGENKEQTMWDNRYDTEEYVYGKTANDFLVEVSASLKRGRALCMAEGEGRNAVFLAENGFDVLAVDQSAVGMRKARALAAERGVQIRTETADLADYEIEPGTWDLIIMIFGHLPPELRKRVHRQVVAGLRPGGAYVLEAYTPEQLKYKTGGPQTAELMMNADEMQEELEGLRIVQCRQLLRTIREGRFHGGTSAVVRFVGIKD